MLSGLANSFPVSMVVQPMTTMSTITFSAAYRLGLLPLFDRYGHYACDIHLSVPTNGGFYTSRKSLRCCHVSGESDIVLGSDWASASSAVLCNHGSGLLDPPQPAIASLPEGYYWTPNEGERVLNLDMMFQ